MRTPGKRKETAPSQLGRSELGGRHVERYIRASSVYPTTVVEVEVARHPNVAERHRVATVTRRRAGVGVAEAQS